MNSEKTKNRVTIIGEVAERFEFSHNVFGEAFFSTKIAVERKSGIVDYIPVMVSERIVAVTQDLTGSLVKIEGHYRSFNKGTEPKRLILNVFVEEWEFHEQNEFHKNEIVLDGFICKPPVYRKTPLGREIADLLIAVNRPYGKSDYIPCICWGRNAMHMSGLDVGTHLIAEGRIQSREYNKNLGDGTFETRVAYEVSISKYEVVE